eukprot:scaffold163231_cov18-Tisochrysis_lutea.AAC.2
MVGRGVNQASDCMAGSGMKHHVMVRIESLAGFQLAEAWGLMSQCRVGSRRRSKRKFKSSLFADLKPVPFCVGNSWRLYQIRAGSVANLGQMMI